MGPASAAAAAHTGGMARMRLGKGAASQMQVDTASRIAAASTAAGGSAWVEKGPAARLSERAAPSSLCRRLAKRGHACSSLKASMASLVAARTSSTTQQQAMATMRRMGRRSSATSGTSARSRREPELSVASDSCSAVRTTPPRALPGASQASSRRMAVSMRPTRISSSPSAMRYSATTTSMKADGSLSGGCAADVQMRS
mmetsp:Transcript_26860/g.89915  ORF Transcript_26860/g.89915 Transcript_26860/m.89915 type:complete len:200 (-) Transcript_26860:150-749(-)